jgi:hypothetical protein
MSLLAVPLLLAGLLTGCGDDSADAAEAPKDATVEEFCQPWIDLVKDVTAKGENISDEDAVKIAKDTADKLAEVGTPKDMPADARKGFELILQKLNDLPDDATKEQVNEFSKLSKEEQKYSDALSQYIGEQCADQLAEVS